MVKKVLKLFSAVALVLFLGLAGIYVYLASSTGKRAENYRVFAQEVSRPLVIAHRGGAGIAPENTLEAFKLSNQLGADILELDVRFTADRKLVVIHDSTVDRTTNGAGKVSEMNVREIQKLDAGFRWTRDDGKTYPFRADDVKIPTLREVFEAFPDAKINLEAKVESPSPVKPICELLGEFQRKDKTVVASFSDTVLKDFRANCRGVATSASPSESTNFLAMYELGLSENYSPEMQALQIPRFLAGFEVVTKDFLRAVRERNLKLHVWTINKKEDMKRLIDLGADGIMTDRPDELLDIIRLHDREKR